jgi:hypothetical protein
MKEVLKLALDALIDGDWYIGQLEDIVYSPVDSGMHAIRAKAQKAIKALEEALAKQALIQRAEEAFEASQQEQGAPVAWAEEIIDDFHALYNSEMIKENDSGDELIRLDAAVCAVEEAAQRHTTTPQPKQEQGVPEVGFGNIKQEQGEPWGACVSGRVFVGALPEHVRKLSEDEGLPIQWLYTTPQQRKPLTDEQIKDVANSCMWWVREQDILDDAIEFARAIEAAHNIKENI